LEGHRGDARAHTWGIFYVDLNGHDIVRGAYVEVTLSAAWSLPGARRVRPVPCHQAPPPSRSLWPLRGWARWCACATLTCRRISGTRRAWAGAITSRAWRPSPRGAAPARTLGQLPQWAVPEPPTASRLVASAHHEDKRPCP